jgi:hypothetical protein
MSGSFFKNLDTSNQVLIYKGLKTLIDTGERSAFHNGDMGHPVYVLGAKGERVNDLDYADRPKNNDLFLMLVELSRLLKPTCTSYVWWYDFSDWTTFCKYVIAKYKDLRQPI